MPWVIGVVAAMSLTFLLATTNTSHILASGARRAGFAGVGHWVVCDAASKLRDPEVARERARFAVAWMLSPVNATERQQERVSEVVDVLVGDLVDLAAKHRENRRALVAQLTQPSIDRVALEEIRRNEIELLDATSRRFVEGFADISETLTPEQRREFVASTAKLRH
jgi:hypothetical protein